MIFGKPRGESGPPGPPASRILRQLQEAMKSNLGSRLQPYRRVTCRQTGARTGTVQGSSVGEGGTVDGMNYPVLQTYSTSTFGAAGGPANGHDMVVVYTSDGNPLVIGHIAH